MQARSTLPIHVFTSFAALPAQLRRCLAHPRQANFFLSLDWFELLFETSLAETLIPRIYVASNLEGEPLCALFCATARSPADRTLLSLANFYTLDYLPSFTHDNAPKRALIRALVEQIAAERPRWHSVRLATMKTDAPDFSWIVAALRAAGFGVQTFFQYENWYLPAAGLSFEDYFRNRPSQLKNAISRRQKKLEKTHRFEIRIARAESPQLEPMISDFVSIYGSSWKLPEPFPGFIPALATRCAKLGILRLGVLHVDGVPAAAQLWITSAKTATIYKLAYDERYGELGVGSILSKEMFRIAIDEDGVDEIDYGVGSEAYKKDWMSSVRTIEGLQAHNRKSLNGLLLATASDTKLLAKKMRALLRRNPS